MTRAAESIARQLGGLGYQVLKGPYCYAGGVRIYRLELANRLLAAYREEFLAAALKGTSIEVKVPDDDCVLLVQNNFDLLRGEQDKGRLNERNVQFQLPVELQLPDVDQPILASLPVFSHGAFMSNVITTNELRGPLMYWGVFEPRNPLGIEELAPDASTRLLTNMKALTTPGGDKGGKLVRRSIVRVYNHLTDVSHEHLAASDQQAEQGAVSARLHPLDYFFNWTAFKQFPDQANPEQACYQALELIQRQPLPGSLDPLEPTSDNPAAPGDYCSLFWDLEDPDLDPVARQKLQNCSIMIDAETMNADIVKLLGLSYERKVRIREKVGDRVESMAFYEVKPTAYMCLDSRKVNGKPVVFFEHKGLTLCYRYSTAPEETHGWHSKHTHGPGPGSDD